jgi:signal transduction histidine kinase
MNVPPLRAATQDLERQKEEVRQGLFRVNTALFVIVAVVVGLALAGIFAAYRASQRTVEATAATQEAQDQLWQSYLAQATAGRLSTAPGRKAKGREVIQAAARIRASLQLRNESIAHMALLDLAGDHQEEFPSNNLTWACSPDLTRYALADNTGRIEIRGLPDHQVLFDEQASGTNVSGLTFSPDARFLVAAHRGSGFELMDLQKRMKVANGPRFNALDFSADGEILALLTDSKTVQFLDSGTGRAAHEPLKLTEAARDIAFAPAGNRLAVNIGRSVQLWDWRGNQKITTLEHDQTIISMSWSSRQLAVGDEVGNVRVWDSTGFRTVSWVAHKSLVDTVLFNHRGDLLVSDSWDGSCKVWDPRTGHLLLTTTRGFGQAFSGDDTRLAYSVLTSSRTRWGWWQLSPPQALRTFDCIGASPPNVFQVDFSSNGQWLSVLESDQLRVLDLVSGTPVLVTRVTNGRSAYFFSETNSLLICADNRVSISSLERISADGSALRLGQARPVVSFTVSHLDSAILSPDRRQIGFLASDSQVALLNLERSEPQVLFEAADKPAMPTISPDKLWLAAGTFHGRGATVWDARSGRKVRELARGNSNPFFSPDSSLLVCAGDKEYRVYETGTWAERYSVPTDSAIDLPNYAAFTADGRTLAIVKERQLVQLIEPREGTLLAALVPPEPQIITWLTFSPTGEGLAVGTAAGLVQIWNLAAIHQDLAAISLDWNAAPAEQALTRSPMSVRNQGRGSLSSAQFVGPALGAVALVVFCAWFVLRRQRRLFGSYLLIDDLMEQRNRELKVAQTELMHSQKMKALGTLAAGIAHDFNNLLSVIRMSNKLIGREVQDNSEVEENVQEVEKAVQQGKHIVASMLGFGNDQNKSRTSALFVPDLVEDTVGLLSRQFLSGITLDLQLDRESPAVRLPRSSLEQILLNLIVNAAEAMLGHGHLRIQVREVRSQAPRAYGVRAPRPAPAYVELVVADTGCGIPSEILPRIFDPFFTTKAGATNRGTGLGLSMIYTMAEQDGMGIEVESAAGQGATFRILIPVDNPAPAGEAVRNDEPVREWHTGQSLGAD